MPSLRGAGFGGWGGVGWLGKPGGGNWNVGDGEEGWNLKGGCEGKKPCELVGSGKNVKNCSILLIMV